jgi:diaminopimelate epimerase
MQIHFYKYQGTGNDFVMIDDRKRLFPAQKELIAHICHRHFGVGADGLILLQNDEKYDFRMVYYNADGGQGSMCGNGGRCTVQFAHSLGLFEQKTTFIAVDGTHEAFLQQGRIHLKMNDVTEIQEEKQEGKNYYFLNTGSPHYVEFVENLQDFDVTTHGKPLRYDARFGEKGTNVNFVEQLTDNELFVRTYERGVEAETYSCGTGVTASVLVWHLRNALIENKNIVTIKTLGGDLAVSFEVIYETSIKKYQNIYLIGEARKAFEGNVDVL